MSLQRVPLPAEFSKMNQKEQIKAYGAMAARISTAMSNNPGQAFYIHNETSFHEEAFLAFIVWATIDRKTVPKNVGTWLVANKYEQLVDDEDQRKVLSAHIKFMTKTNLVTSMLSSERSKL
jgi:hypothetical protein